ncbi:UNVERIFIED_CONTAM: hypothetical protein NCL1_34660 [Trichonephila clavipes]
MDSSWNELYELLVGFKYHIPLRINMLHVPTPVVAGDSILLKCEYELGNETLYAVKWYKNMGEFYRYVPASDPPLKTFPQAGIDVDVSIILTRYWFLFQFINKLYAAMI